MGGMGNLFSSLFDAIGFHPTPLQLGVMFAVLVLLIVPMLQKNARTDRARRLVKLIPDTPGPDRPKLAEQALKEVWDHPEGLVVISDEAIRLGLNAFANEAVARLKDTGRKADDLRRLQRDLAGNAPVMPEQVLVQVEAMLESGMVAAARERLAPALLRWPDHPELLELDARLRADAAPEQSPA